MGYKKAKRYLKKTNIPSSMLLDSLESGGTSLKSIDGKVLEAQQVVKEHLVRKFLNYNFKK